MAKILNFNDAVIELANRARAKKALDVSHDLLAAAYSADTSHGGAKFTFKGLYLKFTTSEAKTVTLSLKDGAVETVLWKSPTNSAATSIVFNPDKEWDFPPGHELKLEITQAGGACTVQVLLLTSEA